MCDKMRDDIRKATLYDLRLLFSSGEKESYTKQEFLDILDQIASGKLTQVRLSVSN